MYRFLRCPDAGSDAVTGLLELRLGLAFGERCLFGLLSVWVHSAVSL